MTSRWVLLPAVLLSGVSLWMVARNLRAQVPKAIVPLFNRMDLNHDGVLDADELAALAPPMVPMDSLDVDGDGVLVAAEVEMFLVTVSPTAYACSPLNAQRPLR